MEGFPEAGRGFAAQSSNSPESACKDHPQLDTGSPGDERWPLAALDGASGAGPRGHSSGTTCPCTSVAEPAAQMLEPLVVGPSR